MAIPADVELDRLLAHTRWVEDLARSLVRDPHAAEDLTQATWVAALQRPAARIVDPRAWLGSVMRNLARERGRRESARRPVEIRAARTESLPAADELVERAECERRVVEAVLRLDEPHRSTLLLRYFESLTPDEIARRAGLPASTVSSRITRAHAQLRERLRDRDPRGLAVLCALLDRSTPPIAVPALRAPLAALIAMKTTLSVLAGLLALALILWALRSHPEGASLGPERSVDTAQVTPAESTDAAPKEIAPDPKPRQAVDAPPAASATPGDAPQAATPAPTPSSSGGRIFGRVFRPDGQPAPQRRVRMLRMGKGPEKYAVTDDEGRFDERDLGSGAWSLATWPGKPELAALGKADERTIEGMIYLTQKTVDLADGQEVEVELGKPSPNAVRVFGSVRDAEGPLDATLTFLPEGSNSMDRQQLAVAEPDRGYSLTLNEPGRFLIVAIVDSTRHESTLDVPAGAELAHDIVLPMGVVAGRIVNAAGEPRAGVRVALTPRAGHLPRHPSAAITYAAVTSADGEFRFDHLPLAVFALSAQAQNAGKPSQGDGPAGAALGEVDIREGSREDLEFTLHDGVVLQGRIVHPGGNPYFAHVWVFDASGEPLNPLNSCDTDRQGDFRLMPLAPGRYTAVAGRGDEWSAPATFDVPRPAELGPLELALEPAGALTVDISGRGEVWIDIRSRDGACYSALFDSHLFNRNFLRDWSRSAFPYRLPAGEYQIRLRGPGGVIATQDVAIRSGERLTVDLGVR